MKHFYINLKIHYKTVPCQEVRTKNLRLGKPEGKNLYISLSSVYFAL